MEDALLKPQITRRYFTVEEYEELVRNAGEGERYEYCDGIIYPVDEYTTDSHNQIVQNAADVLKAYFYPRDCRVFTENVRLLFNDEKEYRLPDVMATCSDRDKQSRNEKRDPVILVEILSPSTAMQDLAGKADSYRKIGSLQAYLVINPAEVWVRVYERGPDGEWLADKAFTSLTEIIRISKLQLDVPLQDLYGFVELDQTNRHP